MIDVLLAHGAYLSEDICGPDYAYRRKLPKPLLKLAVEFASLDDVRWLLSHGVDVNAHPRLCIRGVVSKLDPCADCDSPLMAAVRRQDIAMMRLLTAHGASVSEEVRCDYTFHLGKCNRKTALLIAVCTEQLDMITELLTSGADVNQSLGPVGTVLQFCYDHVEMVQHLVQLGADPNVTDDAGRILKRRGRVGSVVACSTCTSICMYINMYVYVDDYMYIYIQMLLMYMYTYMVARQNVTKENVTEQNTTAKRYPTKT